MNKSTVIAFIAGAAIGSVVAFQYAKKKYEQYTQDKIDEGVAQVKEYYAKKQPQKPDEAEKEKEETPHIQEKPSVMEYAAILKEEGYTDYSTKKTAEKTIGTPGNRPYVISPDEFGEYDDYERISLMYYADQILCDDEDVPVDNVEDVVGFDSLNHFGEYEDDTVFVRNDARRCDYEILKSLRTYREILKEKPYKAGYNDQG